MIVKKNSIHIVLRLLLCSALAFGLAACSSGDDDGGDPPATDGDDNDDDDGDDDAVQESENDDGTFSFIVPLSAEQEVPPEDNDSATGEGNLTIDKASGNISGSVAVSDLTGQASMAHIHQGIAGTNGGVLVTLTGNDEGSVWTVPEGTVLDPDGLTALGNGELYINVHTAANPGGEVRGQIIPEGILLEDSELSGEEEVPPVATDASGVGISTVNTETGVISATIFVDGLDNATMAHIHAGAEGVNGDVIITLEQDADNAGIWRTPEPSMLTAEQVEAYMEEALYFNVHSDTNPGGEIRGQL